jgi:hypothetical protein
MTKRGHQDDQEVGKKGIDPVGGAPLEAQMSSDFKEGGVARFGSADVEDGSINVSIGGV